MRVFTAILKSTATYSQSKKHWSEKKENESHEDFNFRTFREQCTVTADGQVAIPSMAVKMAIDAAVKKKGEKIVGRANKTWKDIFEGGIVPSEPMFPLFDWQNKPILKESIDFVDVWANADGIRGSAKRVLRRFPIIPQWKATVIFDVTDDSLQEAKVEFYLAESGKTIGIGRFRPQNGGFNGRYGVVAKSFKWSEAVDSLAA